MIYCSTVEQFLDVLAGLTQRGIKFIADGNDLTVTLTGGY